MRNRNGLSGRARRLAERYNGLPVYVFQVSRECMSMDLLPVEISSPTAGEACAVVKDALIDQFQHPCEVETIGVRGGLTHRYAGWYSVIARLMESMHAARRRHPSSEAFAWEVARAEQRGYYSP